MDHAPSHEEMDVQEPDSVLPDVEPLDAEAGVDVEDDWHPGRIYQGDFDMHNDNDNADNMTDMINVLQTLGVNALDATRYVAYIVREKPKIKPEPPTFIEAYGMGNIVRAAGRHRNLNVKGLDAFDLRTCRPDGLAWDFTQLEHRKLALKIVRERKLI